LIPAFINTAAARLMRSLSNVVQYARQRLTAIERHEVFRRPTDRIELLRQRIDDTERRLRAAPQRRLADAARRLAVAQGRLAAQHPRAQLARHANRLSTLGMKLNHRAQMQHLSASARVNALSRQLTALNPTAVLQRGYSITRLKSGKLVKRPNDVRLGDVLVTHVAEGTIESTARDPQQPELF